MTITVENGVRTIVLNKKKFLRAIGGYLFAQGAAPNGNYRDIRVETDGEQQIVTITMSAVPDDPSGSPAP